MRRFDWRLLAATLCEKISEWHIRRAVKWNARGCRVLGPRSTMNTPLFDPAKVDPNHWSGR